MGFNDRSDKACPVCGHPTGDCCGTSLPPIHIIGPNLFPSLGYEEMFIVQEDVWVDEQVAREVTTKVRLAKAGDVIPVSRAQQLGLL